MTNKSWSSESNEGLCVLRAKNNCLIIIRALLKWKCSSKEGDCHDQMNTENYMKWAEEKLDPSLPPYLVVVVNSVP